MNPVNPESDPHLLGIAISVRRANRKWRRFVKPSPAAHPEAIIERRTGAERRRFSYTRYIPERRSGRDRRRSSGNAAVSQDR